MYQIKGVFATARASRYLQQLCKHFGHKFEVSHDERSGCARFPFGQAKLAADESCLAVTIRGEDEPSLDRGRGVIDSHLERFAFRESFANLDWGEVERVEDRAG